jgi:hypothetical protein
LSRRKGTAGERVNGKTFNVFACEKTVNGHPAVERRVQPPIGNGTRNVNGPVMKRKCNRHSVLGRGGVSEIAGPRHPRRLDQGGGSPPGRTWRRWPRLLKFLRLANAPLFAIPDQQS